MGVNISVNVNRSTDGNNPIAEKQVARFIPEISRPRGFAREIICAPETRVRKVALRQDERFTEEVLVCLQDWYKSIPRLSRVRRVVDILLKNIELPNNENITVLKKILLEWETTDMLSNKVLSEISRYFTPGGWELFRNNWDISESYRPANNGSELVEEDENCPDELPILVREWINKHNKKVDRQSLVSLIEHAEKEGLVRQGASQIYSGKVSGLFFIDTNHNLQNYLEIHKSNRCIKSLGDNIDNWSSISVNKDKVVVTGGYRQRMLIIDLSNDTVLLLKDVPHVLQDAGVVYNDQYIYLIGGTCEPNPESGEYLLSDKVLRLKIELNKWEELPSLKKTSMAPLVAELNGEIYVLGDDHFQVLSQDSKWIDLEFPQHIANATNSGIIVHEQKIKIITPDVLMMYDPLKKEWKEYELERKLGDEVQAVLYNGQFCACALNDNTDNAFFSLWTPSEEYTTWRNTISQVGKADSIKFIFAI